MARYQVVKNLSNGMQPGEVHNFGHLSEKTIEKLQRVGAIRKLLSPPLIELTGWSRRAARLAERGIVSLDDFLDADPATIAEFMKVKLSTVDQWRAQLKAWAALPVVPKKK